MWWAQEAGGFGGAGQRACVVGWGWVGGGAAGGGGGGGFVGGGGGCWGGGGGVTWGGGMEGRWWDVGYARGERI